jgi:uncharacterized protein
VSIPPPSQGSAALITGASSGIGREIARRLAERGHGVVLVARRLERLEQLARELAEAYGVRAEPFAADLGDRAERERLLERVDGLGLAIEVLVNNAGFGIYSPFATEGVESELRQVEVLVNAVVHLNGHFLPAMRERRRGAIVNVSSTSAFQALPGNGTYAACKAFVLSHSEALTIENRDRGVTVTAVCPGPVRTEFQDVSGPLFTKRLPGALWCEPQRVAADTLAALEAGRTSIVPGGPLLRAAFAPNRVAPAWLALPIARRVFAGELERGSRKKA